LLPGNIEHVLTQIACIETDDRNKPNVLAHHVVLEEKECSPEGPAWLMALPGFHCSEWNGPPIQFSLGRPIPALTMPPSLTRRQQIARQHRWLDPHQMSLTGFVDTESPLHRNTVQMNEEQATLAVPPTSPCPRWKELTGDAGWGGVLAATAFSEQPVVLIYTPGLNILPLYVEALALLPPRASWLVTFCTHFVGLPDAIICQWKGVLAGSDEAKQLTQDQNNLVLDLTTPLGKSPTGKYVDFAQHGQEHMLPMDADDYAAVLANADTKWLIEAPPKAADTVTVMTSQESALLLPTTPPILLPPKQAGLFGSFLHRSSRSQFYFLYGIMFALVLFLSFLAIDHVGNFGIVQRLQNWNRSSTLTVPDEPEQIALKQENVPDLNTVIKPEEFDLETSVEPDNPLKNFEEDRENQKEPLSLYWEDFDVPEYLGINFPVVQNDQIDIPDRKTFGELRPLHPFGSALELRFIPLFELPKMRIETRRMIEKLPDLIWQVEAFDPYVPTQCTPMFRFQLTEAGLVMDWQLEGLNNQFLYDTVIVSLGFLLLSVTDTPETAKQIPLFAPVITESMRVSDIAKLSDLEPPEYVVELPFASELWQRVIAELKPLKKVVLKVREEPTVNWIRAKPSTAFFFGEIRSSQQVATQMKSGETYEDIWIEFTAEASFERVVWRTGKNYQTVLESIKREKENWEKKIRELDTKIFEGDDDARKKREAYRSEIREILDVELKRVENTLEKLPAAYDELKRNESAWFHYSVFLETGDGKRTLRILTTE